MDFYLKNKQFDRINRIVRIKRPPAEGTLAAGDRKSPKSCKSCLSKKHKIESIPMFHISGRRWRKGSQSDQIGNFSFSPQSSPRPLRKI